MDTGRLYEAVILQALSDISDPAHREEGMHFFSGERFRICAAMACMDSDEARKIMETARLLARNPGGTRQRNETVKSAGRTFGSIKKIESNIIKSTATLTN